jgi:hypothetical protein
VEDNSRAGQGPVLLDIGGDVGAAVVVLPAALAGTEIEARPTGGDALGHHHFPHVGVVARPVPDGSVVHSAVFGELPAGSYELYERPAGPVRLRVAVTGGAVTEAVWPV